MRAQIPRRLPGAALGAALLALAAPGGAAGDPAEGAVAAAVAPTDPDDGAGLAELTRTLEELLAVAVAKRPDALAIPEAEVMGIVAEELLQEGDADLAASLLGEAIALLEEEGG